MSREMERRFDERPIGPIGWMDKAACNGMDTEIFFPETGDNRQFTRIKKICGSCEVQTTCLDYAVRQNLTDGWFGGMSPENRSQYARRFR